MVKQLYKKYTYIPFENYKNIEKIFFSLFIWYFDSVSITLLSFPNFLFLFFFFFEKVLESLQIQNIIDYYLLLELQL